MGRLAPTGKYWSRHAKEMLGYESGQERRFLILMSAAYGVHALETQSRTLDLVVNGKPRTYTPDVLVTWRKGYEYPYGVRQVWFEVKTREDLRRNIKEYAPLFREARAALAAEGVGFRVVTQRTFTSVKVANAEAMIERHLKQPDEALFIATHEAFWRNGWSMSLGSIIDALTALGVQRYKAWDAIWFWIEWRYIDCDITQPVDENTLARWWWAPPEGLAHDAPNSASRSNRLRQR
jgi:hypothetical protein